jgi:ElaB/YqjD/DUF883 family membrane-anchored ribosome-binding protein
MTRLSIREAAQQLGVAELTIRRRLRSGLIPGYQEDPPNGRWWVDFPDDENGLKASDSMKGVEISSELEEALRDIIHRQDETISQLREQHQVQLESCQQQLEAKDKQIEQLHILLQQAQAALPVPRDNRPWWQRWWRRN